MCKRRTVSRDVNVKNHCKDRKKIQKGKKKQKERGRKRIGKKKKKATELGKIQTIGRVYGYDVTKIQRTEGTWEITKIKWDHRG